MSGYAGPSRSSDLIIDARHENVVWFANTENCVERSVASGVSLSTVWSGDLTFLGTERKVITPYIEQQEVLTPKKCENESQNGLNEFSCFDVAYANVTKYRTDWLPFDGKAVDLSSIASELEQKTQDVLSTAESSEKTEKEETIRFCFRTSDKEGQAHISYIAVGDSSYASDESTNVNITSQSLNWQPPTPANASYISRNYVEVNLSIKTDHLDSFKFNWNGTNYSIYDPSLVLGFNFNNNSAIRENATRVIDYSKYNNTGTMNCIWNVSGKFGKGLDFNGTNTYVSVPDNNRYLTINGSISIEAWIYAKSLPIEASILSKGGLGGSCGNYDLYVYNNYLTFMGWNACSSWSQGKSVYSPIATGVWQFVAISFNGTYVRFFINGNKTDTMAWNGMGYADTNPLEIGKQQAGAAGYWNGTLDEIRIYNRSLTDSEIRMHYQSEFQKYNSTEYRFYDNVTNLNQGMYTYYGWANDTFGNSASSETRTLTYDASYPVVQLVTLNNTAWTASSRVNFTYNVSQAYSGISYCNLTVNTNVVNSSTSITKNTNQTLYANLANGAYNWSVNCTGQNSLMNWSTRYNISVATTTTTTTTTASTTTTTLCSLGLGCGSCTGWVYLNSTFGTLQVMDADNNTKYDRVCCGGTVSNYTRY